MNCRVRAFGSTGGRGCGGVKGGLSGGPHTAGKVVQGEPEQGRNVLRGVARFGKDIGSRKRNRTAEDRWCDRVARRKIVRQET